MDDIEKAKLEIKSKFTSVVAKHNKLMEDLVTLEVEQTRIDDYYRDVHSETGKILMEIFLESESVSSIEREIADYTEWIYSTNDVALKCKNHRKRVVKCKLLIRDRDGNTFFEVEERLNF